MPIFFETPAQFRAWLRKHAASERECIVGFYKRGSGKASISWPESVDEALCVGWIDGVRTRIDEESYKIRFSPRRQNSIWSAINVAKVRSLKAEGRMTQPGLDVFARRREDKSRVYAYEQAKRAELPAEQSARFQKHSKAWQFFLKQAPSYRHLAAWYITSAKRPETREARLAKVIAISEQGLRL
jgi:uncharacterized protein YdeI (YjbR/CyaY-like superfamily)